MRSFRNFDEDLRNWFSKSHPDGGWKRVNTKVKQQVIVLGMIKMVMKK